MADRVRWITVNKKWANDLDQKRDRVEIINFKLTLFGQAIDFEPLQWQPVTAGEAMNGWPYKSQAEQWNVDSTTSARGTDSLMC